jgi:urease accessory protein
MLSVSKLLPQGRGLSAVLVRRAAQVELDWDVRQKSRFDVLDSQGRNLGVFLPRGQVVRGGDVLVAEDGSLVKVTAKPQPVMVVRACAEHGSPFDLLRAAYHLGNRHVQMQLEPDQLKLEPDHVLAAMLRRMHLIVSDGVEAFEPESGAYASAEGHADHGHDHDHDHEHEHEHEHERSHDHDHGQDHGHEHAHGHDHEHGHDQAQGRADVQDAGDDHVPVPAVAPEQATSNEHRQAGGELDIDPQDPDAHRGSGG